MEALLTKEKIYTILEKAILATTKTNSMARNNLIIQTLDILIGQKKNTAGHKKSMEKSVLKMRANTLLGKKILMILNTTKRVRKVMKINLRKEKQVN
jgi:hypothetical protein